MDNINQMPDQPDEQPEQTASLTPVAPPERLTAVDTLRGVAVLGILVINIPIFAYPSISLFSPAAFGDFTGLNLVSWYFSYPIFMQKFLAIFSMLFGAGLVLMFQRAEQAGVGFRSVYYRRLLWLFVIGMLHAYFLWYGDVLVSYALCGLLLYPLRKAKPRALLIAGILVYLVAVPIQVGSGSALVFVRGNAESAEKARSEGREIAELDEKWIEAWQEVQMWLAPSAEEMQKEVDIYRNGYGKMLAHRAGMSLIMQTQAFIGMVLWRVLGLMLIGMALMKLGVFSAARSKRFYWLLVIIGYGAGLPLVVWGMNVMMIHKFDAILKLGSDGLFNYLGSVPVALGHAGVVMLLVKYDVLKRLRKRLAAVGRMAFTNYLLQTVICTIIFYGYGFALFGQVERSVLLLIVFGVWVLQVAVSPIWLRSFRYGPVEWLWRTLTYRKRQSFKAVADGIGV